MTDEFSHDQQGKRLYGLRELAEKAGLHSNTVTNVETERYAGDPETLEAIRRALEKAGVEFTIGKRPGVRLKGER
jgi:transcriptional regulator with XRE-family HTH domain